MTTIDFEFFHPGHHKLTLKALALSRSGLTDYDFSLHSHGLTLITIKTGLLEVLP